MEWKPYRWPDLPGPLDWAEPEIQRRLWPMLSRVYPADMTPLDATVTTLTPELKWFKDAFKVRVSDDDTSPVTMITYGANDGFLIDKIRSTGATVTITQGNPGADEYLNLEAANDGKVKVSADDTTAGYLNGKLVAGDGISLTEGNPAGNEILTIAAVPDDDDLEISSAKLTIKDDGVHDHHINADVAGAALTQDVNGALDVAVKNSIEVNSDALQLVGDVLAPGNLYYYGTNAAGAKSYYVLTAALLDEKVKADATDPTAGYLDAKVQLSIDVDATNHALQLEGDTGTFVGSAGDDYYYGAELAGDPPLPVKGWYLMPALTLDYKVKVSADDPTGDYLAAKVSTDSWLSAAEVENGSETLKFSHIGPVDPGASVDTIGDATEGAEAAEGTTYNATSSANGLALYAMTRVAYYDAGDAKLYGYVRLLTFDVNGHFVKLSAETRVALDVPVICAT